MRSYRLVWIFFQVVLGMVLSLEILDFLKSDIGPLEQFFGLIYVAIHLIVLSGVRTLFCWWFFRGMYIVGVVYTIYFFQDFYPILMMLLWMGWFLSFFLGLRLLWWRSWSLCALITFALELIVFEAVVIWGYGFFNESVVF